MSRTIGKRIKVLRKERGYTQAELAVAVSVSVQAVSKWECGGTPDVHLLPTIAGFFAVSIDSLFGYATGREASVEALVQQTIMTTPENRRVARACKIGFAAVKGLSGIPNIIDLGYTDTCGPYENDCTRCRILFDDGFAYASADITAPSVFLLPEPDKGYRHDLFPLDDYVDLFTMFADKDMMQILFYLYSRRAIPFSMQHITSALDLTKQTILDCLESLRGWRWIEEEEVELEAGTVMLYRPILSEAFMAFMYFASELLRKPRLWFLSNSKRTKPLLP